MNTKNANVLWFTGLSGSGKTTIALDLKEYLEKNKRKVLVLDGDVVRDTLHSKLSFSRKDIRENNRLIANMSKKQLNNYDYILIPIISPYRQDRIMARNIIGDKNFKELFVRTPIEKCIARDPKGLYKKAMNGEIKNFIGISEDNPYEEPLLADIEVDTSRESISKVVQHIFNQLKK